MAAAARCWLIRRGGAERHALARRAQRRTQRLRQALQQLRRARRQRLVPAQRVGGAELEPAVVDDIRSVAARSRF